MVEDRYLSSVKGIFSNDLDYVCLESIKHIKNGDAFIVQPVAKIFSIDYKRNIYVFKEMKFIKISENNYEPV